MKASHVLLEVVFATGSMGTIGACEGLLSRVGAGMVLQPLPAVAPFKYLTTKGTRFAPTALKRTKASQSLALG